jgi:hypothetical protein
MNDLAPRFSKMRHSSMKVLELVKNYLSARKSKVGGETLLLSYRH